VKVTVVGAGIVGCAVAYELASRGASVTVVDARGVGLGATQASAGILAPSIEGHSTALLTLGECSLALYDGFVARASADASEPIEYERSGTLQVAFDAAEARALAQLADGLRGRGVEHELGDGADAVRLEPAVSRAAAATLLVPGHGYIAVAALTDALARAATRRGASFVTSRVTEVRSGATGPHVIGTAGSIEGDAVVVAAGSWSSDLMNRALRPLPVKPIRGQLLQLRAPNRVAGRVIWGPRCYLVPRRDGSVLVGATVEDVGFDERATVEGVRELLGAAVELVPALEGAVFEEVRVGLRPSTPDELPAIGASTTMRSVFYATGHYRNGVLLAPLTALLVADLVLEGRERAELSLTRPGRLGL
jgi:glycine oxidase